jgi:radical SAM superfamily enzyme YgiQ (UPF0313 family)
LELPLEARNASSASPDADSADEGVPFVRAVLISTYELGHQPLGIASPAAWLRGDGVAVDTLDLSRQVLDPGIIEQADLIAFHLPMHTATRIALAALPDILAVNNRAHLCFYGLYAPMNETHLRSVGAQTILGGEFEDGLLQLTRRLREHNDPVIVRQGPVISTARQLFQVPDRTTLPPLERYGKIVHSGRHLVAGYTESTRGCRHQCRHCPIVPVYGGTLRVVQADVVLADIDQQVTAGAEHITFGDPDFFNAPAHARRIVGAMHERHPHLTYDATIKVEHLVRHADQLPWLRDTGCLFVTTAAETIDDRVLQLFDKRHTTEDFVAAVQLCRDLDLVLTPTFIPFHPWTSVKEFRRLLSLIDELDLVDAVAPVQLTIRLLITAESRLLELPEVGQLLGQFNPESLTYEWSNADTAVDSLHRAVVAHVEDGVQRGFGRTEIFNGVWHIASGFDDAKLPGPRQRRQRVLPTPTEQWFCCAEPLSDTLAHAGSGNSRPGKASTCH